MSLSLGRPCPCGHPSYDACCGPIVRGERLAATPEELMRSRYSAYALGDADHVFRTWHPRTRPDDVVLDPALEWTRLEVLNATDDEVEFRAHHRSPGREGVLHERSVFEQRAGRWFYLSPRTSS